MSMSSHRERALPFAAAAYAEEQRREIAPSPEVNRLRTELRSLRNEVARRPEGQGELRAEIAALRGAIQELAPGAIYAPMLRAHGIERGAWPAFEGAVAQTHPGESLEARFRDALSRLARPVAWPLANERRCVIGLVGPSGVGKTTTAAKLAARAIEAGRSVVFVSCDVFRVGALEQIRRFAALLDVRCVRARSKEELRDAIVGADEDVVVADTAGCTPEDASPEMALAAGLEDGRERRIALCLPAATRWTDAARAARIFACLGPTEIISTKLDETDARSGILHAACAAQLPVSTLTFGHRVPEDIAPATANAILDAIMQGAAGRRAS